MQSLEDILKELDEADISEEEMEAERRMEELLAGEMVRATFSAFLFQLQKMILPELEIKRTPTETYREATKGSICEIERKRKRRGTYDSATQSNKMKQDENELS